MQQYLISPHFLSAKAGQFARRALATLAVAALVGTTVPAASAQGLFSPVIRVNDQAITEYELQQRARFLTVTGTPGNPLEQAREVLIEDKLKLQLMNEVGLLPTEEEVIEGMTTLAQRTNLSLDEFLATLGQAGVDPQTLRDFTRVGIGWREYIGARFLGRARPSDAEIDQAMGSAGTGGVQVLLSEIIIPLTRENAPQVEDFIEEVRARGGVDTFSAAASQVSAADSRENGGRLPWMDLTNLPPQLRDVVLNLKNGEISEPISLQGAVALFQMRGIREIEGSAPRFAAIEYATYLIPGGRSPEGLATAQDVINRVDTCDDFYGVAQDQAPEVLTIDSLPPTDIPRDIALELAKLDPGETSTAVTRNNGQTLALVMLCGRTSELAGEADRQSIANALTQQRLETFSNSLLSQLKSEARIIE
ncbi:peptidylprolyl isomerase [Epibacterium ulvae]|uniref:peptidylprolyl isomerase n=1 Tax=Epibacterium ulvae TaxID=1156985 RepID=UPI001BFC5BC6|nr:peptidylprolyl isomerase [Epibacterium ulvae]MBT8155218.1 peptidylprolyl isomerase [Epibacterium ulvae]